MAIRTEKEIRERIKELMEAKEIARGYGDFTAEARAESNIRNLRWVLNE